MQGHYFQIFIQFLSAEKLPKGNAWDSEITVSLTGNTKRFFPDESLSAKKGPFSSIKSFFLKPKVALQAGGYPPTKWKCWKKAEIQKKLKHSMIFY